MKKPRNADPMRRKNAPTPSDEVIEARLESWLTSAVLGQRGYARLLGLRERILRFSGDGSGGADAAVAPGAVGM